MWGRMLSVIFSLFSVYGIYLLTRKVIGEKVALWSAFIYAVLPLNIISGRAFMPESMMLMCSVYGIYFFLVWTENYFLRDYLLSLLFITLAVLIKIPSLYLGLPLAFLAYNKYKTRFLINPLLWIYIVLVLIPVFLWYEHAHHLQEQYGLSFNIWGYGTDKWGNWNLLLASGWYKDVLVSVAERHLTYTGFIVFLIGLFIAREKEYEKLFDFWLLSVIFYFLIVAQGVRHHDYYQLPLNIPASVFMGKVFTKYIPSFRLSRESFSHFFVVLRRNLLKLSFFYICLLSLLVLCFVRYFNLVLKEETDSPVFKLSRAIELNTSRNDLIIIVNNGDPVELYHSKRKGWIIQEKSVEHTMIADLVSKGAKYIAGEKSYLEDKEGREKLDYLAENYRVIINETNFYIFDLTKKN